MNEFQRSSSFQGRAFEQTAVVLLRSAGWGIQGTNVYPDPDYPEIDICATEPVIHRLWYVEAKGSWNKVPGLERGDTVKKAIAVAYDLMDVRREWSEDGDNPIPYMLITSHLPRIGSLPEKMLQRAMLKGVINEVRVLRMEGWA